MSALLEKPILEAEGLTLGHGAMCVFRELSISFGPGITAILGPNGAGKTTLIEGLLRPLEAGTGKIRLDGIGVNNRASSRQFFKSVGYMPQGWRYFDGFTAQESVEYSAWLKGIPAGRVRAAAYSALEWVGLLSEQTTKVRKLSGGMRQRVGLAEAFVNNPRAVLLDEPTVGLDPAQRASFRSFLMQKASDRAIVLSTHLTDDVAAVADRVLVVHAGRIAFDDTPEALSCLAVNGLGGASAIESGYLAVIDQASRTAI